MRLVADQKELSKAIALAMRAVPSRTERPVLANLLIKTKGTDRVTFTGFDQSKSITAECEAIESGGSAITLPAKLLSDLVNKLTGEIEIDFNVTEGSQATLTQGKSSFKLPVILGDEYPQLPELGDSPIEMELDGWKSAIKQTQFACSTDLSKGVLGGIKIQSVNGKVEFAATDGHRLSVHQEDGAPRIDCNIPAEVLSDLTKLDGETLQFRADEVLVQIDTTTCRITSRLLEGPYPNYKQLIPQSFDHKIEVDRKGLLLALERIELVAANRVAKLHFNGLGLTVEASDSESSGSDFVVAQCASAPPETAFNIKYLAQGLRACEEDTVTINLNTPTSPVTLTEVGSDYLYLVMPVQIRE
ncbi:MAG: DNA polymerase III subunit beta [Cyanobacteria bacterium P01_H01_bin.121]